MANTKLPMSLYKEYCDPGDCVGQVRSAGGDGSVGFGRVQDYSWNYGTFCRYDMQDYDDLTNTFDFRCGGDCCPEEPSWAISILLPSIMMTLPICQLFTPVLASILVMMCVLQVHGLHLETIMNRVTSADETLGGGGGQTELSVLETTQAFVQVKEVLDKTSARWSIGASTAQLLLCGVHVVSHHAAACSVAQCCLSSAASPWSSPWSLCSTR